MGIHSCVTSIDLVGWLVGRFCRHAFIVSLCISVHFMSFVNCLFFITGTPFLLHHQVLHVTSSSLTTPLCRYSWSLLVDPTHICWEETWATVEGGRYQLSSAEQRYIECSKLGCLTSPLHHCCSVCYIILSTTGWWCACLCSIVISKVCRTATCTVRTTSLNICILHIFILSLQLVFLVPFTHGTLQSLMWSL